MRRIPLSPNLQSPNKIMLSFSFIVNFYYKFYLIYLFINRLGCVSLLVYQIFENPEFHTLYLSKIGAGAHICNHTCTQVLQRVSNNCQLKIFSGHSRSKHIISETPTTVLIKYSLSCLYVQKKTR